MTGIKAILLILCTIPILGVGGCGKARDFNNPVDADNIKSASTDTKSGVSPGNTTESTSGTPVSGASSKALQISNYLEMIGITDLYSVSHVGTGIVFTGRDSSTGVYGALINGSEVKSKYFALMSSGSVALSNQTNYVIPSGLGKDDPLYLFDPFNLTLFTVDLSTLSVTSKINIGSPAIGGKFIFKRAGRWAIAPPDTRTIYTFGLIDGALIEKTSTINSRGESFQFGSHVYYDGTTYFDDNSSYVTIYDEKLTQNYKLATTGFKYREKFFLVSDGAGTLWGFGCAASKCYKADVQIVGQ